MFSRLDTVILRVRELTSSREWYEKTLDLHSIYEDLDQGRVVLGLDNAAIVH